MRSITDTGIRGFLKWLQQDQPGIYARAAPIIAQQVPDAFSDREQSMTMGALMGLADDAAPGTTTFFGDSAAFDDSASVPTDGSAATTTDVANAANSGAASPSTTSVIGNIVNSVAQYFLTKQQADIHAQATQQQLSLAAAGLPPNATSTTSLGVRMTTAGASVGGISGNVVAIGLLAAGLWFAFGRRRA